MSSQPTNGLLQCFDNLQGAYCVRKLTEFLTSIILLTLTIAIITLYCIKYQLQKKLWIVSILSLMAISLLSTQIEIQVMFSFVYSIGSIGYMHLRYSRNLYFLFIVGYVCKAFLLKYRKTQREDVNVKAKDYNKNERTKEKTIFYGVFIAFIILYTSLFILSIIRQVKSQENNDSGTDRYCQEVQYLCFDVLTTIMSIVVVVILYKNQQEEKNKYSEFSNTIRKNSKKSEASLLSDYSVQEELIQNKINNPLNRLLIWVLINVLCQIMGLIQSGLLLDASPPQCLIIKSSVTSSNYLSLAFTFLSMYFGIIGTLWYIILVKLIKETSEIDRSILFSQEVKVEGNIQLFLPSKEETIISLQE